MLLERSERATARVERRLPSFLQAVHQAVHDPEEDVVPRRFGQQEVKRGVGLDAVVSLPDELLLIIQNLAHPLDVVGGRAARGEGGQVRLDHHPDLEQLSLVVPGVEQIRGEGIGALVGGIGDQEGPFARPGLQDAEGFECADGFANRGAADIEGLGQFTFCGQAIPDLQTAGGDEIPNLSDDLFRDPNLADDLKCLATHRFHAPPPAGA